MEEDLPINRKMLPKLILSNKAVFAVDMDRLGLEPNNPVFKSTPDKKHFAFLDIEIKNSENEVPCNTKIYSYFHNSMTEAEEDVYMEAVGWLKTKFRVIIDAEAERKLEETNKREAAAKSLTSINEDKYEQTVKKSARLQNQKNSAIEELLAVAQQSTGLLRLVDNTTPLKFGSIEYPHMIYMGPDPPKNEKQRFARTISEVYALIRLD